MDPSPSAPREHPDDPLRLVSAGQARADGFSRSAVGRRLQSGAWQHLLHGVYLAAGPGRVEWSDLSLHTRVRAALLLHGPEAVASHATAVELHGLPGRARDDLDVHLTLPAGRARHQRPGIVLHFRRLTALDCVLSESEVPCTSVRRTLADVLRTWSEWDSVSVLDCALGLGLINPQDFAGIEELLRRQRGAVDARRRLRLGDGRAQSPLETRIRLIATAAGLPPDHLQYPVRHTHGRMLGIADMAWRKPDGRTLVAEADGHRWHDAPAALFRDRHRANDFTGVGGIDMVRFTWEDSRRPAYVGAVLRHHLHPRRS